MPHLRQGCRQRVDIARRACSVTQTRRRRPTPDSPGRGGCRRGSPAVRAQRARRLTGRRCARNSLKAGAANGNWMPLMLPSVRGRRRPWPGSGRPLAEAPACRQAEEHRAVSAHSPWLEQMLEVAFSRGCAARGWPASARIAACRSRSSVSPTSRPGMARTSFIRAAKKPTYGPPKETGMPKLCPSPATMSARVPRRPEQAEGDPLIDPRHQLGPGPWPVAPAPPAPRRCRSSWGSRDDRGGLGIEFARQIVEIGAAVGPVADLDQFQLEVAAVGGDHSPPARVQGPRHSTRRRLVRRTAISAASAQAEAPSYIEALATSIPVSWADQRLELEDRLQRPLADLRLVRGVGGIELAARDQLIDRGRD